MKLWKQRQDLQVRRAQSKHFCDDIIRDRRACFLNKQARFFCNGFGI